MFSMDWDKLKYFYAAAKMGSFTAAGKKLHISQSSISRSVISLEERLGVKLFVRHSRKIVLTNHGEILLSSVQKMLEAAEEGSNLIKEDSSEPQGVLRVRATAGFVASFLVRYIPEFTRLYPKLQLSIVGSDSAPALNWNEADVVIYPLITDQSNIEQHHIGTFHLGMFASPSYLEEFGKPAKPEELQQHRLLAFNERTEHPFSDVNWHLRLGMKPGNLRSPHIEINNAVGLCRLAEQGQGIISVAKEQPHVKKFGLIEVLPEIEGPSIDAYLIYPSQLRNSQRVICFRDYLTKCLSEDLLSA